jgi:hypothetical protein
MEEPGCRYLVFSKTHNLSMKKNRNCPCLFYFGNCFQLPWGWLLFHLIEKVTSKAIIRNNLLNTNNGCAIESSKYVYALPVDGTDW